MTKFYRKRNSKAQISYILLNVSEFRQTSWQTTHRVVDEFNCKFRGSVGLSFWQNNMLFFEIYVKLKSFTTFIPVLEQCEC